MIDYTALRLDNGMRATTESSMAKPVCAETLYEIVDRSMQVMGGLGITDDTPVAQAAAKAGWAPRICTSCSSMTLRWRASVPVEPLRSGLARELRRRKQGLRKVLSAQAIDSSASNV